MWPLLVSSAPKVRRPQLSLRHVYDVAVALFLSVPQQFAHFLALPFIKLYALSSFCTCTVQCLFFIPPSYTYCNHCIVYSSVAHFFTLASIILLSSFLFLQSVCSRHPHGLTPALCSFQFCNQFTKIFFTFASTLCSVPSFFCSISASFLSLTDRIAVLLQPLSPYVATQLLPLPPCLCVPFLSRAFSVATVL